MSNSVVKVTETTVNDSLILVIGEDGTVSPDKKTVEAYLNSRSGETQLQIMQVNKSDGKSMDVTVDTLTYLASHNEEGNTFHHTAEEMEEIERNLISFRMDHDYTPLTSPRRPTPVEEVAEIDELAQTLSILEGSNNEQPTNEVTTIKVVKTIAKSPRRLTLNTQIANKNKIKSITQSNAIFKQPNKTPVKTKTVKQKSIEEEAAEDEEENYSDEDFTMESEESEDDANDSDYEIDESPKAKSAKKGPRTPRLRVQSESTPDLHKSIKTSKIIKPVVSRQNSQTKIETEPLKVEKPSEISPENKVPEKKPTPKKEKKPPKPIPDDFALFSTPDIIRRVGGKQDNTTPTTPTTPSLPESPKLHKPAKIFQGTPSKSMERTSLDSKEKRLSTDGKSVTAESTSKQPIHRLSTSSDSRYKERRLSLDVKPNRHSLDGKPDVTSTDKISDLKKLQHLPNASSNKTESNVTVQGLDETTGGNSNESLIDNHLEPIPSAEDIRAIIQNEDTKTFTTSLIIPEPSEQAAAEQQHVDQSHINLETAALDLDPSILDNINSDLISEDILYQVAQSLVDNAELQNAIDKSLVDENLVLDTSVQQSINQDHNIALQQSHTSPNQVSIEMATSSVKGTQIMRSGGRVVVIPPIERPTTRSRNKRKPEPDLIKPPVKSVIRLLDDEHVSGGELDSSSDDDKSDDDPDKLWCICNQPHNNRFMICCDTCEEWYHGKCVNVTKAMGQMMEQEGKEWICIYCKDGSLKRPAAAARRVRKASRTSATDLTGNEKKGDSLSSIESSSSSSSSSSVPGCLVCGKPCRTNSIYCSDPCILKHAKVVEKVVVFERSSGTIYSGSNAPSAANLDKWLQQHPGFEVVRSANANKPVTTKQMTQSKLKLVKNPPGQGGVSLAIQRKGVNVNILRHSPKQQAQTQQKGLNKQHITGFKIISKQVVTQPRTKLIQAAPAPVVKTPGAVSAAKPKLIQTTLKPTTPQTLKDKPMPQKTPKARQAEDATPQSNKQENIRENVKKTLCEQLTNRLKLVDDIKVSNVEVLKISTEIESQLFKCFGDTGQKYRNKYRSLIFNIKDIKNQTLWRRICEKSTNPYQLVRLSPDDLASQELALWRERENKHQLEMITKSELEQLGRKSQFVFKTHKGEQVLEDRPTDSVDNTEVVMGLPTDDGASPESPSDSKKDSKEREKKTSKHSRAERDKSRDHKLNKEKDKTERKDRKREHRSSSRDRSHRKRSRSKDRHSEKHRSRSRDKDRYRRSSHKSSRHRRDSHNSTEKLDKKSKEILEQLVDNKIVPPLEDRLWKHVQQEDITTAPVAESDSDHEPTSTVTIPTPPRVGDSEDIQTTPKSPIDITEIKEDDEEDEKGILSSKDVPEVTPSFVDDDGSRSPPPKTQTDYIWKGTINMVDVAQISITAHEVSGDCTGLGEELPPCLDVVGRISPDTVWDYIGKMKCSNSKAISLLRLNATNMEEKMPYIALYSYLSSRNRLGVVKSSNKAVKDFYILPLASQKPIPQSLLPLSGPGFEESRPALLLGIIVRDKRKRPLFGTSTTGSNKRSKLEIPSIPTTPITQPTTPSRSYTPPPTSDPRLKQSAVVPKTVLPESPKEEPDEDMDEPYSPEDSDPDTMPPIGEDSSKASSHLNATDLSNLLTGSVKSSSFLETGLTTQTFEPFNNKFDSIPGLDESAALPANSLEIQRKMEELDQRIAMQKAEIQNMSQDIASSTNTGIGTSALASIALPSNLQQILDSIKGINASNPAEAEAQMAKIKESASAAASINPDLTIPLLLPKISARSVTGPTAAASSPTIPLNLPKHKSKLSSVNSPKVTDSTIQNISTRTDKSASVLSSLSEEDLIRKAAEMLGETDESIAAKPSSTRENNFSPASSHKSTNLPPSFNSGPVMYTPPSNLVPPPTLIGNAPLSSGTSKAAQLDVIQPPIPGLDD